MTPLDTGTRIGGHSGVGRTGVGVGRAAIDVAVGILMVRDRLDRDAASRELIRRARASSRGLGATAAAIVLEVEQAAAQ